MVDFKKRLATRVVERPVNPGEIYRRLDRASDKGPLRPAQEVVLDTWFEQWRTRRDVALKLHTGEGKTLIGLIILQSKLNELADRGGRALYLCPNRFLVDQTLAQARQFGVTCVPVEENGELPAAFLDGKAILVALVQKLFNGLTKFGLGPRSERVDALVVDDAHACIDAIKNACVITLNHQDQAYQEILALFAPDLQEQGVGTYAELQTHASAAFLPVPYWGWVDRHRDVAAILAKHTASNAVKFAWPLIRDRLQDCLCLIAGKQLLIAPYRPPLELFESYAKASHRVFMSATISDDSFLVRGLGVSPEVVTDPLTFFGTAWSGEKMVLIPSNIDDSLTATEIVHLFARPRPKRYGVVALVPSFEATKDWQAEGAVVATTDDIQAQVDRLRTGKHGETLVVANRYDGIDLPDETCRILVLDGKPFGESLLDRYSEACRPRSDVIAMRMARVIEQGMGRAVRGEKDYCVVVLSGADLVRVVRTQERRDYFSPQTRKQIEIGLAIADYAREELPAGADADDAARILLGLVEQSLRRDDGWKEYYVEQMSALTAGPAIPHLVDVFATEDIAERLYEAGNVDGAVKALQGLLDAGQVSEAADRGWYLQEMARYRYPTAKGEAFDLQAAAHRHNRYLLKPTSGVPVSRLEPMAQRRAERIREWVGQHADHRSLMAVVNEIVSALRFGTRAEPFERALQDLGTALGFASERPDKEWKAGPDNLWALRDGEYLLLEAKSEVEVTRLEISKHETGQMNNASAWFAREYPGAKATRVLVIPARQLGNAAGFTEEVVLLRAHKLSILNRNIRAFFAEFHALDLRDISEARVQVLLRQHQLTLAALQGTDYYEAPRKPR
ncbi:MAG TPA: DEAD/DEAH box helicase family protein [Thermoanaerobaculia bacterium]|nr:DEAD/DEAH box helicase family protein [Thermoanaerobaculia bacterium]